MAINNFIVDVLGTSFSINVDEDTQYLDEILAQYRAAVENTKSMFNIKEPLNAAVLTGFIVSEELHRLKQQICEIKASSEDQGREAEEMANKIIARIDKVLEDTSSV